MTGIICLDKPENITSFSAVKKAGYIVKEKKAGHTGTLDPMATGVLPIAFGGATRFIELLPCHDKSYIASLQFGIGTDTLDITGEVRERNDKTVSKADFLSATEKFTGEISQLPPMYSAIKKNGVRLYELARKGIEVEVESRKVNIKSIKLLSCDEEKREFIISVECSAGTYIRSLARDIGNALGVPCVLSALRRTKANGLDIDKCATLENLEKDGFEKYLLSVDELLKPYPEVFVSEAQAKRFSNGGELSVSRIHFDFTPGYYRVYSPDKNFLGVGEYTENSDCLQIKRLYIEK